jgi:hypothetical protein
MALSNSKVSGKQPVLQTRQQFYDAEVEKAKALDAAQSHLPQRLRKRYPLPEIVKQGDVAFEDTQGNKMLVREGDVNANDIRYVDPDDGSFATPWYRPGNEEEIEAEWNYMNA